MNVDSSYAGKLVSQIEQYRAVENIHDLPSIFHYWSNKFIRPRMNQILDSDSIPEFYARPLLHSAACSRQQPRFLSIGSGDCSVEIEVANKLISMGLQDFEFVCLEVSPHLIERGSAAIESMGLADHIRIRQMDVNSWQPDEDYSATMANHSLHHLVALEAVFEGVRRSLRPRGVFVTSDVIGRNGHMRWPETLEVVELIWEILPANQKFNYQMQSWEEKFLNFDCSTEGFEGIRAQDILPLLMQRFNFHKFLAFGGIIDVLCDRAHGHNFDPTRKADLALIDLVQCTNDALIDNGSIKPTTMLAVLGNEPNERSTWWRHWVPEYCVRRTAG